MVLTLQTLVHCRKVFSELPFKLRRTCVLLRLIKQYDVGSLGFGNDLVYFIMASSMILFLLLNRFFRL